MPEPDAWVEVVYALPDRQRVVQLPLRAGMTALEAVREAGLERDFPNLSGRELALGIYGHRVEPNQRLRGGDRVEVYRPLKSDPRDSRRKAVQEARSLKRGRT